MTSNSTTKFYFGDYCNDNPFWDTEVSWKTDRPDLTLCFIDMVPSLVPLVFIAVALIIYRPRLVHCRWKTFEDEANDKNDDDVKRLKFKNILTTVQLCLCLIFLSNLVLKLAVRINLALAFSRQIFPPFFYSVGVFVNPSAALISSVAATSLIYGRRRDDSFETGAVSLVYWSLTFCCQLLPLQHYARRELGGSSVDDALAAIAYTAALISLLLILSECSTSLWRRGGRYERACAFSRWSFLWVVPTLWKGIRKTFVIKDLDPVPIDYQTATLLRRYKDYAKSRKEPNLHPSVGTLMGSYKTRLVALFVLRLALRPLRLFKPICLGWLISHVLDRSRAATAQHPDEYVWKGFFYVCLLFVVSILGGFLHWNFWFYMNFLALKIQNTLMILVFRKSLRVSSAVRQRFTTGEIVNLMSVDSQRFFLGMERFIAGLIYPLELLAITWLLYIQLGTAIFAGYSVFLVCLPLSYYIGKIIMKLRKQNMTLKDDRVKFVNEILNGIKGVKFYAWEEMLMGKVMEIRWRELAVLKKELYWKALLDFNYRTAPILVNVIAFVTFTLSSYSNVLTAEIAFVSLDLFNLLHAILWRLPDAIYKSVLMYVSSQRINKFLGSDDIDDKSRDLTAVNGKAVSIEEASFSWHPDETPLLKNINVNVKKGEMLAVIGSVGSGKSMLLQALLGEIEKREGKLTIAKNIAYVSQRPWIQNCTVRENILFGKPMNQKRYNQTIDACALLPDLQVFPNGDETEIGDRGVNLSGGQKMRISLARAIYADAELYLLDDPLSSVDGNVGNHIFVKALSSQGMLGRKSRVVVINNLSYLSSIDSLLYLEHGKGIQFENVKELMSRNPASNKFCDDSNEKRTNDNTSLILNKKDDTCSLQKSKLIVSEDTLQGVVSKEVFMTYFKNYGSFITLGFVFAFSAMQFFEAFSSLKLIAWVDDITNVSKKSLSADIANFERRKYNLMVYSVIRLASPVCLSIAIIFHTLGTINAAQRLHDNLLRSVIAYPLSFFDTVPLGRIMNRFSSDVEVIDSKLPEKLFFVVETLVITAFALLLIAWVKPFFLSIVPLIIIGCYLIKYVYIEGTRQLQRLESMTRSPIFSVFHEALEGTQTIRAFRAEDRFEGDCVSRIDENMRASFPLWGGNRWISFNLEMLGCFLLLACSLYAILDESTSGGEAGLMISLAIQITSVFGNSFREIAHLKNLFVAVERIKEYSGLITEDVWKREKKQDATLDWLSGGKIKFINYSARYRENLNLILKGINVSIEEGMRIGVVGRTGAGKSSLTLALFRILEADEGWIEIDDRKTKDVYLYNLRSNLSIIPQDPVVFSGSLRWNLDPFDRHEDERIWKVLKSVQLKDFVAASPKGLDMTCLESGENLSHGQRQLICLARAMLRDSKILLMDESTAAVDEKTDELIQKTIKEEFVGCTIITIAHRIKTIMDYDAVIVLEGGKVIEFDEPMKLARDTSSAFHGLVKDAEG